MSSSHGMAEYVSHKIVHAAEIVVVNGPKFEVVVRLANGALRVESVKPAIFALSDRMPVPGDYLVVYADGYTSISPKAPFDEGYSVLTTIGRDEPEEASASPISGPAPINLNTPAPARPLIVSYVDTAGRQWKAEGALVPGSLTDMTITVRRHSGAMDMVFVNVPYGPNNEPGSWN